MILGGDARVYSGAAHGERVTTRCDVAAWSR